MTYKRLYGKTEDNYLQISKVDFPKKMKEKLYYGRTLKNTGVPKIFLKNRKGYIPDILIGGTSMLIISDKVKKFLEKSSENDYCEFIPLDVHSKPKHMQPYFILNILDPIPCFDFKNSIYKLANDDPRSLYDLKKMVIDDSKTSGRKLFYMYEFPVEIFINEEFGQEMTEFGVDNIRLLPLIGEKN